MPGYLRIAAPLLVAMQVLVACNRPGPPASAPTVSVAVPVDALVDSESGEKYRYEIRYAALPTPDAALAAAMRAFGEKQKRDFIDHLADEASRTEGPNWPWVMRLDFEVRSRSADFVSVLGSGEAFTGGAHGNPLLASFVLHRPSRRVLALPELFVNGEDGLRAVATEARRVLRDRVHASGSDARRIDDGTAPKAENYTVFLIDVAADGKALGVVVIFPAYQVASYAQGAQEVSVSAARFRQLLKAEFKSAFAVTAAK